jgi:hypothetical protein
MASLRARHAPPLRTTATLCPFERSNFGIRKRIRRTCGYYDSERKRARNSGRTAKDLTGPFQSKGKAIDDETLVTGAQSLRRALSAPPPKGNFKENSESRLPGLSESHPTR